MKYFFYLFLLTQCIVAPTYADEWICKKWIEVDRYVDACENDKLVCYYAHGNGAGVHCIKK